jgi:hypothetical protein
VHLDSQTSDHPLFARLEFQQSFPPPATRASFRSISRRSLPYSCESGHRFLRRCADRPHRDSVRCPCCEAELDLTDVRKTALLGSMGGATGDVTRAMNGAQIPSSGACSMTCWRSVRSGPRSEWLDLTADRNRLIYRQRDRILDSEGIARAISICKVESRSSTRS